MSRKYRDNYGVAQRCHERIITDKKTSVSLFTGLPTPVGYMPLRKDVITISYPDNVPLLPEFGKPSPQMGSLGDDA
jgi:hypothetical protein